MTTNRLSLIPGISIKTISQTCVRITATDGFSLTVNKVDRMTGPFWAFDSGAQVHDITHFHLRHLIHQALNP